MFIHKIYKKDTSTNIKTSLNTAALAFDSIKNLGTDLNPATLAAYNTQLSGLTATQQKMALSTTNLTLAQQKQVLSYIAETAAAKSLTAQQITELSIDQKQALIKAGLITQEQIETGVTLELSKAQLQKIITSDAISTKDKELILGALGVTGANLTETSSWEVLGASIKKTTAAMLKWLFLTPAGWATLAITAIAGTIVAYNKWGDTLENNRKKLEELKSEAQTISSDLQTFNSELQTTQQRISELESKGNLTFTEAEELENLRKQNNELQRSIDLLRLKEKENNKGKNKTFVKTMQKNVDVEDERVQTGRLNPDDTAETEMITEAELIERKFNTLDELQEKLRHASTETEKKAIQEQIDKITKYLSECNEQYIEDAEGIDYIQNPTTDDDRKVNEWLDYINDFQDKMAIAMGGDNAKENAFNRLVDNWKFDELLNPLQKLGKEGKVTLDTLKEKMSDPVFAEFVNKLVEIGFISGTTDGSLRFLASAFNGTTTSAKAYLDTLDDNESISNFINNLDDEAKALGTTKDELSKLTAGHIVLNNTKLSLDDKINQIKQLGIMAGWAEGKVEELVVLMNRAAGNFPKNTSMNRHEKEVRTSSAQVSLYSFFGGWEHVDTDIDDDKPPYSTDNDDKDSSSKNEPLDNYLKYAESLYKVHQDEAKYINDLQWAYNNLTKDEDERLKVTEKINEAYRDMADNRIKDLEHQIEMTKNLKGENADVIAQLNEIQRVSHEEADRLRSMGYDNSSNEIQDLQKSWWDAEKEKLSWRFNLSKDWINQRNTFGDWKLFKDNEVDAWERVIKWLKEEYPHAIEEIKEAEESLFEARKEQFDKATDFASSYYDSKKTLLQSYFDVTNSIAEAQHEINKELAASKTMYEYLDEDTRELLFNQEDYNALSKELIDIQSEADRLKRQYEYDLDHSTLNTIEEITSNYEMQYEMLMKSYEIAKADLEVAKKKAKLDNVLNERNVRMRINGEWQYVANTQDVINAQSELADAEYAKKTAIAGKRQAESINDLTAKQDALGTTINLFEDGVIDLTTAVGNVKDIFGELPSYISGIFNNILSSVSGVQSSSSGGWGSGKSGGSSGSNATATVPGVGVVGVHVNSAGKTTTSDLPVGTVVHTSGGDYEITGGTGGNYTSKKVEKHAAGTRFTPGGLTVLGEVEPETFIDNNGHLIPINQPTIGNIGAGGIVFNQDQMTNLRSLWDLSNIGTMPTHNISNITNRQMSEITNYQMYGNMIFDGNNPEEIFKKMADFFKNTRYKSN